MPAPASKTALAVQGSFLHGAGLIPGAAALPVCAEPAALGSGTGCPRRLSGLTWHRLCQVGWKAFWMQKAIKIEQWL